MNRRNILIAAGAIVLAIAWYAFRPELLFVDRTVNEEFPGGRSMASLERGPMIVTRGSFESRAHETRGGATVYQLADGRRTLRLSEFETSNDPDVHVYLTTARVPKGNHAIQQAGFVDLGSIKGNKGDQNYEVPADVDLNRYRHVAIRCARFGVNFGEAELQPPVSIPAKIAEGAFHGVAHETRGTASIYRLPEGKKLLRLSGFETSNGPHVHVYLIAAPDARDNDTVTRSGFVRIAALKGNIGDQNYELPDGIDLDKYRAVTIWCRRFGVNFGTAPLASVVAGLEQRVAAGK